MERSVRIQQLYGYAVCLIAVVVFLMNVSDLIDGAFNLSDPLHANGRWGGMVTSLGSYAAYRANHGREIVSGIEVKPGGAPGEVVPDSVLRARYDALREEAILSARHDARRTLTRSILLLLLSSVIFFVHWQWLARRVNVREPLRETNP